MVLNSSVRQHHLAGLVDTEVAGPYPRVLIQENLVVYQDPR